MGSSGGGGVVDERSVGDGSVDGRFNISGERNSGGEISNVGFERGSGSCFGS